MAAENLMFLSQDVVGYTEAVLPDELNVECVTEEVITDDWVLAGGQERLVSYIHANVIKRKDLFFLMYGKLKNYQVNLKDKYLCMY